MKAAPHAESHRVCLLAELEPLQPHIVPLKADGRRRREAIVVRDLEGAVHAYLNECMHIAIPLDLGSGKVIDAETGALRCLTHGALYRIDDGYCFSGPCTGQSLDRFPVVIEGGEIFVHDTGPDI